MWSFAACTRSGADPEKRKRCGIAARQGNTSRRSTIFLRWLGAWQCGQGQYSELAWSSGREVCSPAEVNGHRGESAGQVGCNSSKTGRRYSTADEEHEWIFFAADSSDDADVGSDDRSDGRTDKWAKKSVGGSHYWTSQQQFWAVTTDTTATTASSKPEYPFCSK